MSEEITKNKKKRKPLVFEHHFAEKTSPDLYPEVYRYLSSIGFLTREPKKAVQ